MEDSSIVSIPDDFEWKLPLWRTHSKLQIMLLKDQLFDLLSLNPSQGHLYIWVIGSTGSRAQAGRAGDS